VVDNLTGKATAVISALRALGHPRQLVAVFAALRHTFAMRTQAPRTSFNRYRAGETADRLSLTNAASATCR
jgi:hypothetical protein